MIARVPALFLCALALAMFSAARSAEREFGVDALRRSFAPQFPVTKLTLPQNLDERFDRGKCTFDPKVELHGRLAPKQWAELEDLLRKSIQDADVQSIEVQGRQVLVRTLRTCENGHWTSGRYHIFDWRTSHWREISRTRWVS